MTSKPSEAAEAANVVYDGKEYSTIREGLASILVPAQAKSDSQKTVAEHQQVFYNPIQQFNRDLSVLAIKAFKEERAMRIRESLKPSKKRKQEEQVEGEGSSMKALKASEDSSPQTVVTGASAEETKMKPGTESMSDSTSKPDQNLGLPGVQKRSNFSILDALSASGLRALRYSRELPFVGSVTANDLTESAVKSIKLNVQHNKLEDKISVSQDDAIAHMYRRIADDLSKRDKHGNPSKANKYDVIDLDPYGTAAPFLDAAVQCVKEGGLLCVTCTDSAVWAGHCYCEKSYVLYGGIPVKNFYSHEAGLRLVLHAIAASAARYGLTIEPLLSVSADFYVRIFVRVHKSQAALKFLASKTMLVYNCDHGCGAWETQYLMKNKIQASKKGNSSYYKHSMAQAPTCDVYCKHCGSKMHLGGPMYGGHIHSPSFIQRILDDLPTLDSNVYGTIPRIRGILQTALEEQLPEPETEGNVDPKDKEAARVDPHPFYFSTTRLAGTFQATVPSEDMFRGALRRLGYQVTRSHCKPGSMKTDAPWSSIFWIMREWIRQKAPVKKENIKKNSPAWKLLQLDDELIEDEAPAETNGKTDTIELDENSAQSAEAESRKTLVFDEDLEKLGREKRNKALVRYQLNPRENWGPMTRARGN
ncbi:hypothetical protein jhhlp_003590 [Lomentospora prolificans]|uniref:tRNA (guanine(26)-N(2))-dimethyltransferase n=1 Tax=Lomentospora prolificans TaxID=41688 RepID=A0A2N3N999_9PEZI|nr:hypothetical protein jhhlp_003590 [Lomentospora prolificans]